MINEQKGYFIVLFGDKKVLFALIVSIFEKGYIFFFLVCCFVGVFGFGSFWGFLVLWFFFLFLTARPQEQPSIWEIFPEYVDTISLLSVSVHSCSAGKGKGPAYYLLMVF